MYSPCFLSPGSISSTSGPHPVVGSAASFSDTSVAQRRRPGSQVSLSSSAVGPSTGDRRFHSYGRYAAIRGRILHWVPYRRVQHSNPHRSND